MSLGTQNASVEDMVKRLEDSRQRGAAWIIRRIGDDGKPVGADRVQMYYRVPWSLQVTGHEDVASAVLAWMERNTLTQEGDLRPGIPRRNWNYPAEWTNGSASYPLAGIAHGAWLLERYDTATAILDLLHRRFQDPSSGGGFVERPECRLTGRQDVLCTAQLGLTALLAGRRDIADGAYHWFERMWAQQPALPNRMYLSTIGGKLATDVPAGKEFGYYLDTRKPRQAFFTPGIAAAFLGRYAMATGNATSAEIARQLMFIDGRTHESKYDFSDTVHVGKSAWGASVMLDIEPDESYFAQAMRMGQWFLDSQGPDGRWEPSKFLIPDYDDDAQALWKTAEHMVLITIVQIALAAHPRRIFGKQRRKARCRT